MGGSWPRDSWFSRKERSSKDSLIWRCRISIFLRRQNWVLTPASLTVIISPPRPNQIRWNRGNESLPERAEAVGETLTLPGLVSADNGTYTCEASNKHGHARALYVLVVYGEDLGSGLSVRTRPGGGRRGSPPRPGWDWALGTGRMDWKVFEASTYAKNDSGGSKAHRVLIVLGPDRLSRFRFSSAASCCR